jgi:hypothetical protein
MGMIILIISNKGRRCGMQVESHNNRSMVITMFSRIGIYKYAEMADVAGLFAPRPVVIVTGRDDASKPIEAVQEAFKDLKKIYSAMGAEKNCYLVVGDGGHRFYAEEGWGKMLPLLRVQ